MNIANASKDFRRAKAGVFTSGVTDRPDIPEPANDNSISWPVGRMLRKEFDGETLRVTIATALNYRRVFDTAHSNAELRGVDWDKADDLRTVQRDHFDKKTGELVHKGVRRTRGGNLSVPPTQTVGAMKQPMRQWHGEDVLIGRIDAKRLLSVLQSALGPLVQPFEDAVVHGCTLKSIGEKEGFSDKRAEAVGKAFVLRGLRALPANGNGAPN